MPVVSKGPKIDKSALIIVDMQNDFLHRDGTSATLLGRIPRPTSICRFRSAPFPMSKDWLMRSDQREGQSCILRTR
jgi:nicotinamidase-related amidase